MFVPLIGRLSLTFALLFVCFQGVAQSTTAIEKKAYRYFQLFVNYEYEDTLKARKYADSSLYWARKSENNSLIGDAHRLAGWYEHDRSRYDFAISHYYNSLNYMRKAGNQQGIADAFGNLGNAYYDKGDLQRSLDMQLESLKINESIIRKAKDQKEREKAQQGRAIALHNTADIYGEIQMYKQAFSYAFQGLEHDLSVKDSIGVAISYNTIATLYKEENKVDSAEYYFKKALEIYDLKPQPYEHATAMLQYATLSGGSLPYQKRSEMARKTLEIRRSMGDTDNEALALIEISRFFFADLSTDSLSTMLERAYHLIQSQGLEDLEQDYFKVYSRYNSRLGDYREAFFALENYLELKAIADEKKHTQDLIAGEIRYELASEFTQDSLRQQNAFANERNQYLEDISEIQNIVYLSIIGFILLIGFLGYYVTSSRRRKKMNTTLLEKNQLVQEQKALVEEKNKSISDSISYARRLQAAILPTPEQINEYLPDSFLMFRPKDVVSGDFYWFETSGKWCFLAVADCTGHGVPGAMVSVVCSNALNRSVNEFGLIAPSEILEKTRELVIETFTKSGEQVYDGMDIALLAIDLKKRLVVFSGAQNGLWIVRDRNEPLPDGVEAKDYGSPTHVLIEFKGDKQPIGHFHEAKPFTQREIQLSETDQVYLMSDGYADQFGGPQGKKFKYIPMKKLLLEHHAESLEQQKEVLESTFVEWKGDDDQVDDICVIGLRI